MDFSRGEPLRPLQMAGSEGFMPLDEYVEAKRRRYLRALELIAEADPDGSDVDRVLYRWIEVYHERDAGSDGPVQMRKVA
ncbi:hypothetical protein [Thioalkalivibrio sp. ALMg11]|uniref:hypothetical protein n=1 Tax=Thioalkalivibrio sp. ALMg11 TaxID=1158165 RepID=UPI001E4750ED|nr:hypothetical protein [Thioalkalivibrio sp. ALMg11]